MASQIKMLSHLDTLEVSNVRRAANRRRYAMSKSEQNMSLIKDVLAVAAEGEEQLVATLKSEGANAQRIEAATALYRLQKGFADVLKPTDLGGTAKSEEEEAVDEATEEDEAMEALKAKKVKKAENQTGVEGFAPVKKSEDPRIEALFKSNETLAAQVQALVAANENLRFEAIAKSEFGFVPEKPETLALALKSAQAAGPEVEKVFRTLMKGYNEVVSKSALLGDIGTPGGGMAGSAWQKIEALADSLTMKSEAGKEMTRDQKIAHVTSKTQEGRALYTQYNEERRQAAKRA